MIKDVMYLDNSAKENIAAQLDISLSILPFIRFVEEKTKHNNTVIQNFYTDILERLKKYPELWHPITVDRMLELSEVLDIIHACTSNYSNEQEDEILAFGVPFQTQVFYYSEKWNELLIDPLCKSLKEDIEISWPSDSDHDLKLYLYKIILERFYGLKNLLYDKSFIYKVKDKTSNLEKYYKAEINIDFIDIEAKEKLPDLNVDFINEDINEAGGFIILEKYIPLDRFKISGFNIIKIVDVTTEESIRQMEQDILEISKSKNLEPITNSIQNLLGSREIRLGYFPIIKLNGKVILDNLTTQNQVLFIQNILSTNRTEEYSNILDWFIENPKTIFFRNVTEDIVNRYPLLLFLTQKKISSYAMIPILFNKEVIGILELCSTQTNVLDESRLAIIERALPTLSYLMRILADNFHSHITDIIRNKYTALQPVVQWKFNEIAFKQMLWQNAGPSQPFNEKINFQDVYPLYTAMDIKDSTVQRNAALQKDMISHFKCLLVCLQKLRELVHLDLIENILYQAEFFENKLEADNEFSRMAQITEFLNNDVQSFLLHLQKSYPETNEIIQYYFESTHPETGEVYKNRKDLELTIRTINEQLEKSIEILINDINDQYPFYFEKFRTDGIEYDIYIGQSLVPSKPFSNLYLKNLRLWQLISTTIMARQTHEIIRDLNVKLETTSLILVYDSPIDIVFRNDERRFDIDGVFNLRYQMIKKRIDKAIIKETNERLTQPGKLSIVYYNPRNETEYIYYLQFLIEKGLLLNDIEKYELKDMQGISGLKAFRVGIRYD